MNNEEGAADEKPTGNPQSPLAPSAAQAAPESVEPPCDDVEDDTDKNAEQSDRWYLSPDWHMVVLTAALLVIGIVTARIFYIQFCEMSKQTRILNEGAKQAAIDSKESATRMERQLAIAQEQARAAQRGADATTKEMKVAQRA